MGGESANRSSGSRFGRLGRTLSNLLQRNRLTEPLLVVRDSPALPTDMCGAIDQAGEESQFGLQRLFQITQMLTHGALVEK